MTPEEKDRFQKECNGCPALDDQLERVRKTEALLVAERQAHQETREKLASADPYDFKSIGIDLAVGAEQTVEQHGLTFSCPAGCEHVVLIPVGASVAEAAITSSTGLASWRTAEGALCWDRHEAVAAGSIEILEPVETLEDYSSDIEDPLTAARNELDLIIGELDADKAWLAATPAPAKGERDLYISALEAFMAAMLKWAQQEERRRSCARGHLLTDHAEALRTLIGPGPYQQESK